jgi:hypothetical protein
MLYEDRIYCLSPTSKSILNVWYKLDSINTEIFWGFFGGARVELRALHLQGRLYHLCHTPKPFSVIFQVGTAIFT